MVETIQKLEAIIGSDYAEYYEKWRFLTGRQKEVGLLIIKGLSNKDIAEQLKISMKTLDIHRACLKKRFNCETINALTIALLKANLA